MEAVAEARSTGQGTGTTSPLRVVHVLHFFGTGGMEKGIETVIRKTSPRVRHDVISLENEFKRDLPAGTTTHVLHKKAGHSLRSILRLSALLRNMKPCVVHTRNWAGVDGIIAARLAGIRTTVHGEHGWAMDDPEGKSVKRRRVRRFLSRWVRSMTCVSRDIERWLREDVRVRCPVVQIYNGVDTETFAPGPTREDVRRELGAAPGAPLVACIGRLDPIKDYPTLLRAFARVRERFPEAHLLCVGDGSEREPLAALRQPGVHLPGTRKDVVRLLQAADVFALASKNEGISNTILEAMAVGLPVVVSRVGGNPELVADGETGRFFEPGDEAGLAARLLEYLGDPALRAAHGAAGRERCRQRFSVDAMVGAYEEVWRSAFAAAGS